VTKIEVKRIALVLLILLLGVSGVEARPRIPTVKLLRSDSQRIVVELTIPDFQVISREHGGTTYQAIVVPDLEQTWEPGQPQVPFKGILLGVPSSGQVLGQTEFGTSVLESAYQTRRGLMLYPSPRPIVQEAGGSPVLDHEFALDRVVYGQNAFYPGPLAEIGFSGYLRDQRVVQLQFYPFQYNPVTRELRCYSKLRVEVSFGSVGGKDGRESNTSSVFERFLASVLFNYESLERGVTVQGGNETPPPPRACPELAEGGRLGGSGVDFPTEGPPSPSPSLRGRGTQTPPPRRGRLGGSGVNFPTEGPPSPSPSLPGRGNTLLAERLRAGDQPMLKIAVEEDGLYRLTDARLQDAGLDLLEVDPRTIKITLRDREMPIYVHGEEGGNPRCGVFDVEDYVEFYGLAMTGPFTARNVYWLTTGGADGLRMAARDGSLAGVHPTPSSFYATLHAEEDHVYWQNIPNGAGQDHWFWRGPLEAPTETTLTFDLRHLAIEEGKDATVRVGLRGKTDDYGTDPDHHTRVTLNGVEISDALWDGQIEYQHQATVPGQTEFGASVLAEGINTLTVESVGDTGGGVDSVYLNWFEVDYWDTFVAEDDHLEFWQEGSGTYQFVVTDFSDNGVSVFAITDPANVARVVNPEIEAGGGAYTVKFQDTIEEQARYLVLTSAQRKTPAAMIVDHPSSLESPTNAADYIIITHDEFYDSVLPLASHRQGKGLLVKTVRVTNIYDEFNYGIFDPQAIRDFLSHAYHNWAVTPLYVLLVGDANMDFKDNFGTGKLNYVPTHIFETWPVGETPNDNWFACVSGDDILPDMFIGRISAQRPQDVEAVVEKIINYEQNPTPGDWNRSALFVADDDQTDFETTSQHLIALLPEGYRTQRVYAREYQAPADPTADIVQHINGGAFLVNYVGHGFTDRWGAWSGGRIFDRSDIASLNNGSKLPFLTTATCLNGFFSHPLEDYSLAEEFLRVEGKGAIAAWSPTGLGFPSQHRLLFGELFTSIFKDDNRLLGPATTAAKISAYAQSSSLGEMVETFVLFGDPALELALGSGSPLNKIYLPLIFEETSLNQ